MRRTFNLCTLLLFAGILFALSSCTAETPADLIAAEMDKYTAKLKAASSFSEVERDIENCDKQMEKLIFDHQDYKLTDEDKSRLAQSVTDFICASYELGMREQREFSDDRIKEAVDSLSNEMRPKIEHAIKGCSTVREFNDIMNRIADNFGG